ncbi:UNVERIFIED_CONTAM: hypothetical protein FKN15_017276 [Acipenser sinensis]
MDEAVLSLGSLDSAFVSNSVEQGGGRWKHSEELERSSSPSVLRSTASKWKESLLNRKRPFVGRCCHSCSPQSHEKLFNPSIPSLGLRNVIYINETHTRHRGWLARRLCYVLFVLERDVQKDMFARNVMENVLNNSRVQKATIDVAEENSPGLESQLDHKAVSKVKRKARAILQEMVANISPAFISVAAKPSEMRFSQKVHAERINKAGIELAPVCHYFSTACVWSYECCWTCFVATELGLQHSVPLVFLPVHKSHIDYLLITFVLFCHNIKAPHIAAGNNLNIPIFSTLIRKLGGFFIRRRLDETPGGKKDVLYRSLLHVYTEELLRQHQFMEIFLEGTRSRSGKASPARAGLLSIVVDSLCSGSIPDVLIVPVGISYDRIIEGNYNREQLGKPKKNESLWGVAQGVFRMLRKNYGCVRVDFTQPFSLKEYLDTQRNRPLPAQLTLEQILVPTILSTRPNQVLFEEEAERHNLRDLTDEPWRRQVISNLAKHALFTANKSSAVMSTHIVACLLLYRHRQGVCLSKLVEDFFYMKEEVLARDFDLGFSGNSEDVVMHALHLFGNCVNITSASRNTEFFISPSTAIPALFELNFYSNGLFHVFITEAIIACCFFAMLRENTTEVVQGTSKILVSQERLIRKAAGLSHFLSNEVAVALEDQEDLSPSPTEEHWPKKYPEPLSWRSDEEDEDSDFGEEQRDRYLKVSSSPEHQEFMTFLQSILGPVVEAYSSAAIFVHSLRGPVTEKDYTNQLFKYLITRTEMKVAAFGESATHHLVKNTVKTFKELGVLKEKRENSVSVLELSSTFLPQANRNKLLQYILHFSVL